MFIRTLTAAVLAAVALTATAAVDANSATRADLETVKGVGPGLSAKIVDARKSAPFKDWTDMVDRVGGIGPGNAARFSQAGLTVAGASYAAGATKAAGAESPKGGKRTDKPMAEKTRSEKATKP